MRSASNLQQEHYELKQTKIAVVIIVLFHLVGLIGLCIPSLQPYFLNLVPYHLLLMLLVIIWSHYRFDEPLLLFIGLVFILGFGTEWVGVHKGWLFGNYAYGQNLGIKVLDIPLIIGFNWFLLVYSAGVLMQRSRVKSMTARIICGALLLVLLDLLIEPVAIHFDYWHWQDNLITYKNYLCWFLVSAVILTLFELFKFKKQSLAAPVFLLAQFIH